MKTILSTVTLLATLSTLATGQVVNINEPGRLYESIPTRWGAISGYHTRTWQHYEDGWRPATEMPHCPDGERVINVDWTLVDDIGVVTWDCEVIPTPPPWPDVTVPMMDAEGNVIGSARVLATAELGLVAVLDSDSVQRTIESQIEEYKLRARAVDALTRHILATTIPSGAVYGDIEEFVPLFPEWQSGMIVKVGEFVVYDGDVYRVREAHTTAEEAPPPGSPDLYASFSVSSQEQSEWQAGTEYMAGQIVIHAGIQYLCVQNHIAEAGGEPPSSEHFVSIPVNEAMSLSGSGAIAWGGLVSGVWYRVESTTNLVTGEWVEVESLRATGGTHEMTISDPNRSSGMYRIVLQ